MEAETFVIFFLLCAHYFVTVKGSVQVSSSRKANSVLTNGVIVPLQDPPNFLSLLFVLSYATPALPQPPHLLLIPSTPIFHPHTLITIPKHGLSVAHSLNLNCSRANCSASLSGLLLFFPAEGAFSVRGPQPVGEACGSV